MANEWQKQHDRVRSLLDDLFADVNDLRRMERGGRPAGECTKLSAVIDRKLGSVGDDLAKLDADLRGSKATISSKEFYVRTDMVRNLSARRDTLATMIKSSTATTNDALRPASAVGGVKPSRWGMNEMTLSPPDDATNRQLLQLQDETMKAQDRNLDLLHDSIKRQKEIGYAISNEVTMQSTLLDDLEAGVDHSTQRVQTANQRVHALMKSNRGKVGCCVISVLIAVLVVVTLLALKIL